MKLILTIKNENSVQIYLKQGRNVIDQEDLTISHNLDTLLIGVIDKILSRNRISRLSLKRLEIPAKLKNGTVSNMILKTIKVGLKV